MPSETLKEILHSSRFLNNALHSVDRELDIAERDIEEKNYSALNNDIFRGKSSLKTAVDEANDIDAAARQALGLSKKEYKRIKFNSSGIRSTGDMRNRHGYETITHSGRVTFPTEPKKDEIKSAVASALGSAPAHASKKSAEIGIGDDDINAAVKHATSKQDAYTNMYEDDKSKKKISKAERKDLAAQIRKELREEELETMEAPYLQELTISPIGDVKPINIRKAVASAFSSTAGDSALSSHPGEASTAE